MCFIGTASGDELGYELRFFRVMTGLGCEPSTLRLFNREIAELRSFLLLQDVVFVGGGNTANMLVVWRRHGLDEVLREAWESGVVMMGSSAGANCWFDGSTTDSFLLGRADPLRDGLGFLDGSFCPHYDSEPERRPRFHELVGSEQLGDGIACDDGAAVHYLGSEIHSAMRALPGASSYRVRRGEDGGVVEEPLVMRQV